MSVYIHVKVLVLGVLANEDSGVGCVYAGGGSCIRCILAGRGAGVGAYMLVKVLVFWVCIS